MKNERIKWGIVGVLITIFIFLVIQITTGKIEAFDNAIYEWILNIRNSNLTNILTIITNLGGIVSVFCIALILTMTMFVLKKREYGIGISLNVLFSSLIYIVLKNIFQRQRPPIEERLIEESGYSFPSGHSTNNMAFYGFIIYLIYKNVESKILRNILIAMLSVLIVLIGFSRIYLRVHYASDVIAGFCLGIICVILFISIIYKKIKKEEKLKN